MQSFLADKVKISGPRIDGSYTITFEVGEYEYDNIKDMVKLNGKIIKVSVEEKE